MQCFSDSGDERKSTAAPLRICISSTTQIIITFVTRNEVKNKITYWKYDFPLFLSLFPTHLQRILTLPNPQNLMLFLVNV